MLYIKPIHYIVISILILGIVSCSEYNDSIQSNSDTQIVNKNQPELPVEVILDITPELDDNGRLHIVGKTNLPNGTKLLVTVYDDLDDGAYQTSTTVQDNLIEFDTVGPVTGLPPGHYEINITMPMARIQPQSVQNIIGKLGENLIGDLVTEDDPDYIGRLVELEVKYKIGEENEIIAYGNRYNKEKADKEIAEGKLASKLIPEIEKLISYGIDMNQYRKPTDIQLIKKCGEMMRKHQQRASDLVDESKFLSLKYSNIKQAVFHLDLCVSCLKSATNSCNAAKKVLHSSLED